MLATAGMVVHASTLPGRASHTLASLPRVMEHVDLDAFYASVGQLRSPELRGKPVIYTVPAALP